MKAKYGLWVTSAEHDAMAGILQKCPAQKPAASGTITLMPDAVGTVPAPKTSTAPEKTAPKKTSAPKPAPTKEASQVVHPGSFCAPVGAHGVTKKGTPMACTVTSADDRARWRSR